MFETSDIMTPSVQIAADPNLREPVALVLGDPSKGRQIKIVTAVMTSVILVAVAGGVIWGWAYRGQIAEPGFWHVSLVSLLFWLSITQGMVGLSALLRLFHASWRYPLNRMLDQASLYGLWVAALLPLLHECRTRIYALGSSHEGDKVWRVAGSFWLDAIVIGTAYIAGWCLLYLTSLPDFGLLRDRAPAGSRQKRFYARLTRRWNGAEHQWRVLRRAEGVLIIGVLASFVASQTIIGWDFQLASARDWDSSIFAPLYTLGSLLGAAAASVLVMSLVRRVLRGRTFFGETHYDSLGRLMIALGLIWFYFRWCDYLTAWYGRIPEEWTIQNNRVTAFPILAAIMTFGCFIAPVFGNMIHRFRCSPWGSCLISTCVLTGLAVQRYLDTVPTFAPNYPISALVPSLPSVLVFLGLAAMFVLTYLLAARYFPIMSWWGTSKQQSRSREVTLGNATVTVMVEDPPVWET